MEVLAGGGTSEISLVDAGFDRACESGYWPTGDVGEGIGYFSASTGSRLLYDVDGNFGCSDGLPDYVLGVGTCDEATKFDSILDFSYLVLPVTACVRRVGTQSGGFELVLNEATAQTLKASRVLPDVLVVSAPVEGSLPRRTDIAQLRPGERYLLRIRVTDGLTKPVQAEQVFVVHGESILVINTPPHALVPGIDAVECDRPGGGRVHLDGSASTDPDSRTPAQEDIVLFEWFWVPPGLHDPVLLGTGPKIEPVLPAGEHDVTLRVTDSEGESDMVESVTTVIDSTPPIMVCPEVTPIECAGPAGTFVPLLANADDVCGSQVTISNDRTPGGANAGALYPLGLTRVKFTGSDEFGNHTACVSEVEVRDTIPPALQLSVDPSVLWPPNHELVRAGVAWQVSDICDAAAEVMLVSAASSEPDDASGETDGNTPGDIAGADIGVADHEVFLRAERAGAGSGRVYELSYRATDTSGNQAPAFAAVTVPHDQRSGPEPLLMRLAVTGLAGQARIYWSAVPGAYSYDVISGDLNQLHVVNHAISLGAVRVLARGATENSIIEATDGAIPPLGGGYFYLIQSRGDHGESGYGTESTPLPRLPAACVGGCP
jgi:hypothetical protein